MKVKLLTALSGVDYNHEHGKVVDMPDDQAVCFIEREMAIPVRDDVGEDTSAKPESVEFAKLNKSDIVAKASEIHGLELDPAMKKADMLAAIDEHLSSATGSVAIPDASAKSEE
jgi:hypothetical protein